MLAIDERIQDLTIGETPIWLFLCTIGSLIVSLISPSPSAFTSSAIWSKIPAFLRVMILLKAKKLTQFATDAIMTAHSSEYFAIPSIINPATTSTAPQMTCEYQKTSSMVEGVRKLASQTHTSSSPVVSILQLACRYRRPIFFVIQNSSPQLIVTNTQANCWESMSPKRKMRSITTAFAKMIWNNGDLAASKVDPQFKFDARGVYTTEEIINYYKLYSTIFKNFISVNYQLREKGKQTKHRFMTRLEYQVLLVSK